MIKEGFKEEKKWSKEKSQNKKTLEPHVAAEAVPFPVPKPSSRHRRSGDQEKPRKEGVPLDRSLCRRQRHKQSKRKTSAEGSVEGTPPAPKVKDKEKRAPKSPPKPSAPAPGKREETRANPIVPKVLPRLWLWCRGKVKSRSDFVKKRDRAEESVEGDHFGTDAHFSARLKTRRLLGF